MVEERNNETGIFLMCHDMMFSVFRCSFIDSSSEQTKKLLERAVKDTFDLYHTLIVC